MDNDLRNSLWNVFWGIYVKELQKRLTENEFYKNTMVFADILWKFYFKEPIDTIDQTNIFVYKNIRAHFFGGTCWDVYNFIDFTANFHPREGFRIEFIKQCNLVLERELSAYRFVNGQLAQITSKEEIVAIEEAVSTSQKPVNVHLKRALELFADRKSPDYRNFIK